MDWPFLQFAFNFFFNFVMYFCTISTSRSDHASAGGGDSERSSSTCVFEAVLDRGDDGARKLGFTVVGGQDSPRGPMGIYIKSILPGGLADENQLREGTATKGKFPLF